MSTSAATPIREQAIAAAHTFAGSANPHGEDGRALLAGELEAAGMVAGPFDAQAYFTAVDFTVGAQVAIYSRGYVRVAIVEKVGRSNVTAIYTTPSAIADAEKYRHADGPRLTRKAVAFDEVLGVAA